ncbi:MCE family protein [Nocardioides acrostichi]|uniref:MCE family protein n=1 Tax=Nocardioides acrostichi TaxID=2784339 RepID=A0A930Y6K5_9ACTN|nr:MlaD family protein [Nocardioides acrostichi]MBF4162455.1 MCE family protein [Nocardioides acrostichi]
MITRRVKIQLLVFALITVVGVTFVGIRYAQIPSLIFGSGYRVTAHFDNSGGGIFAGGEVTYRGVNVGRVDKLVLTDSGVDVVMDIKDDYDTIPANTLAVVGNKSAVGEQYVDLQPQTDDGPYLKAGSEIAAPDTRTPIPTEKILSDLVTTVGSVNKKSLKTTITELGEAFDDSGRDLQTILDSGSSFLDTANANFETTRALIRDGNTVLKGQIASESAIRTFARQLDLFSTTLADADPDLRRLIDNGAPAAAALKKLIDDNGVELGDLINNLVTTGQVIVKNIPGIRQLLVIYPYVVEGGFTVVSKSPDTGLYDAHFGLILTTQAVCHQGYGSTDTRPPQNGGNRPMNTKAGCTEPITESNARGPQNLPRPAASYGDSPVVASYDPSTGKLTWGDTAPDGLDSPDSVAPPTLGKETWKWLYLQPLTPPQ